MVVPEHLSFPHLQILAFVAISPGILLIQQISGFPILEVAEYLHISFLYTTS